MKEGRREGTKEQRNEEKKEGKKKGERRKGFIKHGQRLGDSQLCPPDPT